MKSVSELIGKMMGENMLRINERWVWSWGNRDYCDQLFRYIFREVDRTYDFYEHLPEYDEVIDWMTNTDDKGLMLMGDCGRGKSVILNGVLPVLFRMKNRVLQPVHAQNFSAEVPNQRLAWGERPATHLDRLLTNGYPAIDELGIEPMMNDYGEKYIGQTIGKFKGNPVLLDTCQSAFENCNVYSRESRVITQERFDELSNKYREFKR